MNIKVCVEARRGDVFAPQDALDNLLQDPSICQDLATDPRVQRAFRSLLAQLLRRDDLVIEIKVTP